MAGRPLCHRSLDRRMKMGYDYRSKFAAVVESADTRDLKIEHRNGKLSV